MDVAGVELRPYVDEDLALAQALECDPRMMAELGGPVDPDTIPPTHRRRVESATKGEWYFVIVPEPGAEPAGTIGVWDSALEGEPIHEIGWMVLPELQGRGIASEALALILDRARSERRLEAIHAFPATTNAPSNALCRRAGFELLGERDFEFRGRPLRCNHWRRDVSAG